jgi:hypothetical protein
MLTIPLIYKAKAWCLEFLLQSENLHEKWLVTFSSLNENYNVVTIYISKFQLNSIKCNIDFVIKFTVSIDWIKF